MAIVENWLPPSRDNWQLICTIFQFFPLMTIFQWIQPHYPMGKTSWESKFNLPGKIGWITMEAPGFITLLYIMYTLPTEIGISSLPWENKAMAGLFTIHYLYRSIIGPLLQPSMSPIHLFIWLEALSFQLFNAISIGSYLGGYGPTTRAEWSEHRDDFVAAGRMELGLMIFFLGFVGNIFHDDELREIRRAAIRNQKRRAAEAEESTGKGKEGGKGGNAEKVYMIPKNGLFWWIFYPHYLCEWIEWGGFFLMGGKGFIPGRTFLINEIATMLPRAIQGKNWYIERFGEEKVAGRTAVIPKIL